METSTLGWLRPQATSGVPPLWGLSSGVPGVLVVSQRGELGEHGWRAASGSIVSPQVLSTGSAPGSSLMPPQRYAPAQAGGAAKVPL